MASKSEQLIDCMSKSKGNAKKIAACKASFAKNVKDVEAFTDKSDPWGNYIRKGSLYKPTGQDSVVLDSLLRDKMKK
jgi:hypothetical protein